MEPNLDTSTVPGIIITSSTTDTSVLRRTKNTPSAASSLCTPVTRADAHSVRDSGILASRSSQHSCTTHRCTSSTLCSENLCRLSLVSAEALGDSSDADAPSDESAFSTSPMVEAARESPQERTGSNARARGYITKTTRLICKALRCSSLARRGGKCSDKTREDVDEGIALECQDVPRAHSNPCVQTTTPWHMDALVERLVLQFLDARSLGAAETVCRCWCDVSNEAKLWKTLIADKMHNIPLWHHLSRRHGWAPVMEDDNSRDVTNGFYKSLYARVERSAVTPLRDNWATLAVQASHVITMNNDAFKGVYCFHQDTDALTCGLRDNSLRVYKRNAADHFPLLHTLKGHTGSVLSVGANKAASFLVSGSSDSTIRVWDARNNYKCAVVLREHSDGVLHVAVHGTTLVSCSKDRTTKLWDVWRDPDTDAIYVALRNTLRGHRSAVNVVDLDERYIITGGGDRVICVWDAKTLKIKHALQDHSRGVSCLHYRYPFMCSGSSDNTVRIWNVETGVCIRRLVGHEGLVRCVRFTDQYVCSGDYDGAIKMWDFQSAIKDAPGIANTASGMEQEIDKYCVRTFHSVHSSRVFRVMMDEFSLVSSSQDDTVVIMDFVNDARWTQTPDTTAAQQRQLARARGAGA